MTDTETTIQPRRERRADRLTVDMPPGTLAALKVHVAQRGRTIRELVTALVKSEISQ